MAAYLQEIKEKFFAEITAVPAIFQSSYYPSLNGLRGVSILMVLIHHFGINHFLRPFHVFVDSEIGVHVFFVISGFLITTLLLKEKLRTGAISLRKFYIRRVLRIIPVAYLFLVVLIALNSYFKLGITALDFVASFLFFKNLGPKNEPYTAHLWTLAVEEQFYLIFPFILSYNVEKYLLLALFIIVVVPLIGILGYYHVGVLYLNPTITLITKVIMYSFWKGPVIILIGSVISILAFKGIIKAERLSTSYFLSFVLFAAAIVIHTKTSIFYGKYISEYLSAIIIAYVILLSLNSSNFLSAILKNGILIKVGILSYSLYIWQELFIGMGPWQPWFGFLSGYPIFILMILKLILVFVIAGASYYFFELKFLKLKGRFK